MNRAWLFGLVLGVPLIGFAVAEGIQAHFNSQLRSAFREQMPDATPTAISRVTIDRLCEERFVEFRDICATNNHLNLISTAAVSAGAVGLALLLCIWVAGLLARTSRVLLLYIFKPGLYLTAIVLIGLVLVHAGVAMTAIYYGESVLLGRVHIFLIIAIGLGALVGVLAIARNAFAVVRKAQTLVIGKTASRSEAPALWKRVDNIAGRLGALLPDHIVVGLDPNFFVTEADVVCLSGNLSDRTLYCSLPLMRILSPAEFDAIIGHELGHYKGLDTQFSRQFYPIYRGTANAIAALQETGAEGSRAIALLPAIAIFSYFLESFSVAESVISRLRELAADKEGATVADATSLSTALVKIHAFSGFWERIQHGATKVLQEGKALVNASKTYAEIVVEHAKSDLLADLAESHLAHPTDSHPPLGARLESLGCSINQVAAAALSVNPSPAAIELITDVEQKEEDISAAYQAVLARQLGVELDSVPDGPAP